MAASAILPPVLHSAKVTVSEPRLWKPRQVLITKSARQFAYAQAIAERASLLGAAVVELKGDRLPGVRANGNRSVYAESKGTLALVVAPPGSMRLQPIPPSADWQFHLAQGCPAHCQYCYLAGSLSGPPITRVFANLEQILDNLKSFAGRGTITSKSAERNSEGTTFECSCYTDPLALEHLTGALAQCISFFGSWEAAVQLRWTTKFDNVGSLLSLGHRGRTRVRFSLNADPVARRFEGGTPAVRSRLQALRAMALAGYPVGLTIAPIMDSPDFEAQYEELLQDVAGALDGVGSVDLTAELITHRFTPGSKEVLLGWYPKTPLDMEEANRSKKRTKFGSLKFVYPATRMKVMRATLEGLLGRILPSARVLYWT